MQYIAVPGLGLGVQSWGPALSALGATEATVLLLPGYGQPTARGTALSPLELAEDVCERLTEPTTLLGHSSSCQIVAHAARLCPELVRKLVLIGPTTDVDMRSWRALAVGWLRNAGHEDPRQVGPLIRQYRRTGLRSMLTTMDLARTDHIHVALSQVLCPVIVVRGAHDRIARSQWVRSLAATAPDGRVVEVPAGAHMVLQTHPRLLAERLALAVARPDNESLANM